MFKINHKSKKSAAKKGVLQTAHGDIETPFFMPIATKGAVKNLSADDMKDLQSQILLSNTYHLMLRPGEQLIKKTGGLHQFMKWEKPILTDSGGFQVFSLGGTRNRSGESLVKLKEDGVEFRSYIDGSKHFLTPEKCMQIQTDFGVDIAMCLDQCVANPCTYDDAKSAVELTTRWGKRCKDEMVRLNNSDRLLFGIVQGSIFEDLRLQSAKELSEIEFDGYAVGGLAVGESNADMYKVLDYTCPVLPEYKPRYLMGVGYPENIVEAVNRGIDMFDCVIPTREARHGRLYKFNENIDVSEYGQNTDFYEVINIKNEKYKEDFTVIDDNCGCNACRQGYTKGYLRYLFSINENLAERLATIHNLYFYLELMKRIRKGIEDGKL